MPRWSGCREVWSRLRHAVGAAGIWGQWPYAIVIEYGDPQRDFYAVGTYVESDITVQCFDLT
jgi:hypothetical protein